jgi:hypothetical protein
MGCGEGFEVGLDLTVDVVVFLEELGDDLMVCFAFEVVSS